MDSLIHYYDEVQGKYVEVSEDNPLPVTLSTKVEAQPDSTATDIAGIVADFNALLAKLRAAGIMST